MSVSASTRVRCHDMIRIIVIKDPISRSARTRVLHCVDAAAWPLVALGAANALNGTSIPILASIVLLTWMMARIWRAARDSNYCPTTWLVCRALGFVVLLCLTLLLVRLVWM